MIEAALAALRRDPRRRGPWGPHGAGPYGPGAHGAGQHGPWEGAPGHGPRGAWPGRGGWPGPHAGHGPGDAHASGDAHAAGDPHASGGANSSGDPHATGAHDVSDAASTGNASAGRGAPGEPNLPQGAFGDDPRRREADRSRGAARGRDAAFGRMARFRMLEALEAADSAGRPLSVSTLAAAIGVDQPRASRLVQEGVERGHVRRVPDPSDARRALLELTTAGRAQLSEVRSHRRTAVEAALADFTPEEAQTFATLFARFAQSWPRA